MARIKSRKVWLTGLVVLSLAGVGSAAVALSGGFSAFTANFGDNLASMTEDRNVTAASGDKVTLHVTSFTANGTPVRTSSYTLAVYLNRTIEYVLRDPEYYQLGEIHLGSGDVGLLGETFESYLYGARAGDRIITDVIPANDTVTGADKVPPQEIRRWYGPFPLQEEVPLDKFRTRFPNATAGDVVQLNPRYLVQIEAITNETVAYRYMVEDGESVPLTALGPTARLTTVIDGDSFFDRLDIETGVGFYRKNDRILNLTHGPYLVQEVTQDVVVVQRLKANLYDFAFQDLYFIIEVIAVEKSEATT